jgi:hypothetical protein
MIPTYLWILVDSKYSQQIISRNVKNYSSKVPVVIIYDLVKLLRYHFLSGAIHKLRNI